jgi:hypothetical protein
MKSAYPVKPKYKKPKQKGFWTQAHRRHIFRTLMMKFGPYEQWTRVDSPTENIEEYEKCLEELAEYFSAEFGREITAGHGAVRQQIAYAIQKPVKRGKSEADLLKITVLCKAAALETGFIAEVWPSWESHD